MPSGYAGVVNTATPGQIRLVVTELDPPAFGGASINGNEFIVNGTGGFAGGTYYVLTSTNVALPRALWTFIATNQFDANGNFSFTNELNSGDAENFYLLQLP
jgi:hypothetical protein